MTQVLTIDDSRAIRAQIRATLEGSGFQVLEAEDGTKGLSALRALGQPGVVLVDYHMPEMDGVRMLEEVVREGAPLVNHEYLILTGHSGTFPDTLIELVRTLSIRVLTKPVEDGALVSAVQQAEDRLTNPPNENPFATLPDTSSE